MWQTNYWTSSAAYPDPAQPQNPYADPMGWVSGYSTPAGVRQAWGNGDGRFLYPPESAADGRPTAPVLDGAVPSIRLEMLRDGIEDYEYLAILRQLVEARRDKLTAEQLAECMALLEDPGRHHVRPHDIHTQSRADRTAPRSHRPRHRTAAGQGF